MGLQARIRRKSEPRHHQTSNEGRRNDIWQACRTTVGRRGHGREYFDRRNRYRPYSGWTVHRAWGREYACRRRCTTSQTVSAPKKSRAVGNCPPVRTGDAALLGESLRDVVSRLVKVVREQSGTHSNAQNETLSLLERSGPVSISTLATGRAVTHQTMRLIVMKLAEQGAVTLMQDAEDRRAYVVNLTDEARAQIAHERSARSQWLADQLIKKTSHEERAVLELAIRTLHKLID